MKKGPSFKEQLVQNASNIGLLATSLFSASYVRDLFSSALAQTIGQPTTLQTYIPFVIAREAVGYLATPVLIKAGLQIGYKAATFLANKAKNRFWKEDKSLSTAVALRPVAAIKPALEITPLQRLQQLLTSNPEAKIIVDSNVALAQTKLFNNARLEAMVIAVEKLQPKAQQEFFAKFLKK